MATIELQDVEKRFDDFQAVKPLNLTIHDGEFVVLLGPSGCGKTTTLRMISGLETVSGGTILLDGENVTWAHPSARNIAFVFQLFALYPHMTVRQNIEFPLRAENQDEAVIEQRVNDVVELLHIESILGQRPGNLSGGDRQRVALARALVRRPKAFLMDEPLGALDAEFRENMRAEIKQLHIDQHATTIYVTHDQVEAMAMGDRIVIMSNAEIQQVGTPAEVYYDPANLFVANFVGSPGMNLITGRYANGVITLPGSDNQIEPPTRWQGPIQAALNGDREIILGFRPEAAWLSEAGGLTGKVYASDLHGAYTMLHVTMNAHDIVRIRSDRASLHPIGMPVQFDLNPEMVRFFNPETELAILPEGSS